jgi:hypothetical protein
MIEIDGKRVHLYAIGVGCYSDYREEWWYHERELTRVQLLELLLTHLDELAKRHEWDERREAFSQDRFGCDAFSISWSWETGGRVMTSPRGTWADYEEFERLGFLGWEAPRLAFMTAAGFVKLEPQAWWHTDDEYVYRRADWDGYEAQLRQELEGARAQERNK